MKNKSIFRNHKLIVFFLKRRTISGICGNLVLYDCDNLGALNVSGNVNYRNQSCVNGCCTQLLICNSYLCNSLTPVPITTTSFRTTSTTSTTNTSTTISITTSTTKTRDPTNNGSSKVIFTDSILKKIFLLVLYFKTIIF